MDFSAFLIALGTSSVVFALGLIALSVFASRVSQMKQPKKKAASGVQESYLEVISAKLAALEVTVRGLPSLWEEERERVVKQANRAEQAVRDHEARVARSAEESDADPGIQPDDADGGQLEFVRPLSDGLDEPADDLKTRANQALAIFGRR